jgi:hypothetical protein
MLYTRDFTKLTTEEQRLWDEAESVLTKAKARDSTGVPAEDYQNYWNSLPLAVVHYKQLFPNNYLNTSGIKENARFTSIRNEFELLLDSGASERQVLNFIRDREASFIIASIFKNQCYNFGHHAAFAFREFELPPNYKVDFLLAGKNSGGYEFIFIELESPTGRITAADGELGEVFRKGLKQVEDWEVWLEANYANIRLVYDKALGHGKRLPREFMEFDATRIHFVVVAGRRKDFSDRTYRRKRKLLRKQGVLLLHYDNLLDTTATLINHGSY